MPAKRNIGDEILEGLDRATAFARGERGKGRATVVDVGQEVDVKASRGRLGYTKVEFANRYGFALTEVQEWEKRRRRADRAARILLKVIDYDPDAVDRALGQLTGSS